MLRNIDAKFKLDILITTLATATSILFITLSYIWRDYSVQILSILIVLLPNIYVIGNLIIRGVLQNEMKGLRDGFDRINSEINIGVELLETENKYLKDLLIENNIEYEEDDFE